MSLKLFVAIFVACCALSSCETDENVTEVQDWLSMRTRTEMVPAVETGYVTGRGFIRNPPTGRNLRPQHGDCPRKDLWLYLGPRTTNDDQKFRWRQKEGHLGYIEPQCGSTVLSTSYGRENPSDDTYAVWVDNRNNAATWSFDEEQQRVVHFGGKYLWSNRDQTGENAIIKVHGKQSDSTKFWFYLEDGSGFAYPEPTLDGRWEQIFAVVEPIGEHTYTCRYKLGKKVTRQVNASFKWKFNASMALGWFRASSRFSFYADLAQTTTWEAEIERTWSIKVFPGQTVATWQYVFEASRFGETVLFRSNILGDTNSIHDPPNITPALY